MRNLVVALFVVLFCVSSTFADIATNLVGRWNFTTGSGTTAFDTAPTRSYDATLVNSVAWAAGPYTRIKALDFDGTDDYATNNCGAVLRNGVSNNLTFACWIWIDTSGRNDFINWKSADGTDEVGFYVNLSSKLEAYVSIDSVGGTTATGATTINTSTWYHVALTKSGNTWTIYLNHVSDGSGTQAANLANHGSSAVWFGSNHDSSFLPLGSFNLDGKMAFVNIYNRALSVSDITELNAWRGPVLAPADVFGKTFLKKTPLTILVQR